MSAAFEKIRSFQNKRLKQARKLREKRERERSGLFVIEYSRDLKRALDAGFELAYALFCPALASEDDRRLLVRLPVSNVFEISLEMMEKACYRQNPSGLLGVVKQVALPESAMMPDSVSLCLALVNLRKPGNIGALLRTADAAGIDAVLLVDTALDLYNPNIIRASTGACFLGNVYSASGDVVLKFLSQRGFAITAAVVDGDKTMFDVDFTSKTVIALGTEDVGLPVEWLQEAGQQVRIPMAGAIADSLNVSVSGAIMMYEAFRQRSLRDFET